MSNMTKTEFIMLQNQLHILASTTSNVPEEVDRIKKRISITEEHIKDQLFKKRAKSISVLSGVLESLKLSVVKVALITLGLKISQADDESLEGRMRTMRLLPNLLSELDHLDYDTVLLTLVNKNNLELLREIFLSEFFVYSDLLDDLDSIEQHTNY